MRMGFEVLCIFNEPLTERGIDQFMDSWLNMIRTNNIETGGGCDPNQASFGITDRKSDHVSDLKRASVIAWLIENAKPLGACKITKLIDMDKADEPEELDWLEL